MLRLCPHTMVHEVPSSVRCVPCVHRVGQSWQPGRWLARRRDINLQPGCVPSQVMRNEQAEESLTPVAPQASMASVDELTALDANAEGEKLHSLCRPGVE